MKSVEGLIICMSSICIWRDPLKLLFKSYVSFSSIVDCFPNNPIYSLLSISVVHRSWKRIWFYSMSNLLKETAQVSTGCTPGIVVQFRELFIPLLGLGCKGDTVQTGLILGKELKTLVGEENGKDWLKWGLTEPKSDSCQIFEGF